MVSINIFYKGGDVHAILRNPYRTDGGSHHAGNKMALDNVRERLALHFDAEASLDSRVRAGGYEVHIRMPYRRRQPRTARCAAAAASRPAKRAASRRALMAARPPVADAPLRVLIVDDEAPARRRLRDLLDDCSAALPLVVVGEAAGGREAIDLLQAVPADLVLTDIRMPDMDGLELARHLLKLPQPPGRDLHHRVPRARAAGLRGQRDRLPREAGARRSGCSPRCRRCRG